MATMESRRDGGGSAVRWFALAAAVLSVAGAAGAHGLAWLAQPGRISLVAYHQAAPPIDARASADPGIDRMPTGSIPSNAVLIRIR